MENIGMSWYLANKKMEEVLFYIDCAYCGKKVEFCRYHLDENPADYVECQNCYCDNRVYYSDTAYYVEPLDNWEDGVELDENFW